MDDDNIGIIAVAISFIITIGVVLYLGNRTCLTGHMEKQIKLPPSIVVGGSKYGGGVAIPIGNGKEEDVFVCDVYK